jgi:hypothetical protein
VALYKRRKLIEITAIGLSFTIAAASQNFDQNVLHEGTPVRTRISRTVSSGEAKEKETVDFETLDDIKIGETIVIPRGSVAMATVTEAVPKRRMGRGGKLSVNIDYVRMPSGEKLALRGIQDVKGGGHTGAMTGAIVATSIVFFPAAPLFLFMHGKDITIPKGHEVTVYTNSDYQLPKSSSTGAIAPVITSKAPSQAAMTNADVLALSKAKLGEALIIEKIMSSSTNFKLDTGDMLDLKQQGVSDAVVAAMLKAPQR